MSELGNFRHPRLVYYHYLHINSCLSFIHYLALVGSFYIIVINSVRPSTQLYCFSVFCSHKLNEFVNSLP